jgi:hypothetical protein
MTWAISVSSTHPSLKEPASELRHIFLQSGSLIDVHKAGRFMQPKLEIILHSPHGTSGGMVNVGFQVPKIRQAHKSDDHGAMLNLRSFQFASTNELAGLADEIADVLAQQLIVLLGQAQANRMLHEPSSKRILLTSQDMLGLDLYQEAPWHIASSIIPQQSGPLLEHLRVTLHRGDACLIIGRPGAGKTTEIQRAFIDYITNATLPHALWVSIRDFPDFAIQQADPSEVVIKLLSLYLKIDPPPLFRMPAEIIWFVDGLDEVAVYPNDTMIRQLSAQPCIRTAAVTTSRPEVAARVTGISREIFAAEHIMIDDWSHATVALFLEKVLRINEQHAIADEISSIGGDHPMAQLASNPLTSIMLAFLIVRGGVLSAAHLRGRHRLFERFVESWAEREFARSGNAVMWSKYFEGVQEAWEATAYRVFSVRQQGRNLRLAELATATEPRSRVTRRLLSAPGYLSLLRLNESGDMILGFVHDQFMEYFVARRFVKQLDRGDSAAAEYLEGQLSGDVNLFIKSIWEERSDEDNVATADVLSRLLLDSDSVLSQSVQGRANAVYYLSRIPGLLARNVVTHHLHRVSREDPHTFVRNGARFSLVRQGDLEAESQLWSSLETDVVAASYNRRLHLEYFGDVSMSPNPPAQDDGRSQWECTAQSLMKHLRNRSDPRFAYTRRIDIQTIRSLMSSRGVAGGIGGPDFNDIEETLDGDADRWPALRDLVESARLELARLRELYSELNSGLIAQATMESKRYGDER